MRTGARKQYQHLTTRGTGVTTLEVNLPPKGVELKVVLTHGSGAGSVEKTFTPDDYPGDEYGETRFAIAFIAGGGFSYRGVTPSQINFRPYNTTGDVTNNGGTYRATTIIGV